MKALLQRVQEASVVVDGQTVGRIDQGLLVFVCAQPGDDDSIAERMIDKIVKLRIFSDELGKMNRSLIDVQAGLLIVSQFTLIADTTKGNRPSYGEAAHPDVAKHLYEQMIERAKSMGLHTESGRFGADMKVHLVNDGPVTIALSIP